MFNRWFQGRYGVDQLSRALIIASLIVSVISWFSAGHRQGCTTRCAA